MEQPITFKVAEQQVVGMLHLPEERGSRVPAVACFHGWTGNKAESHRIFVTFARMLAYAGIAVLRIDFRGSGDSEGDFSSMTVTGELEDARAAVRFLQERSEIDPERIGVVGLSMGGLVAALLLGEDDDLKAGVLWSAVSNMNAAAERKQPPGSEEAFARAGYLDMGGWLVGQEFVNELPKLKPLEVIRHTGAPILIIHGDEDEVVPHADAEDYAAALAESRKPHELHTIKGAGHTYDSQAWETEVLLTSLEWLDAHL
jgi:hypothetical protein